MVKGSEFMEADINQSDVAELKTWLFKENIRLEKEREALATAMKEIEEERKLLDIQKELLIKQKNKNALIQKQLDSQNELFEKKWKLLEDETRRLAIDKQRFERDKEYFADEVKREKFKSQAPVFTTNPKMFFVGIDSGVALKKRYKELLKIFHPDNVCGSNDVVLAITKEYESLKRYYIG